MNAWDMNFCQNIRYLRQAHHMTQKEMSRILGVSVATYGRIERCMDSVRLYGTMVRRVCDHFSVPADDLLRQNWTSPDGDPVCEILRKTL